MYLIWWMSVGWSVLTNTEGPIGIHQLWGICDIGLTSDRKLSIHGNSAVGVGVGLWLRMCRGMFLCGLKTVMFVLLVEYGGRLLWVNQKSGVSYWVIGSVQPFEEPLNVSRWKWLGHALRLATERLFHCALFFQTGTCLRMVLGGQSITCEYESMETLSKELLHVVAVTLMAWGPRDLPKR